MVQLSYEQNVLVNPKNRSLNNWHSAVYSGTYSDSPARPWAVNKFCGPIYFVDGIRLGKSTFRASQSTDQKSRRQGQSPLDLTH